MADQGPGTPDHPEDQNEEAQQQESQPFHWLKALLPSLKLEHQILLIRIVIGIFAVLAILVVLSSVGLLHHGYPTGRVFNALLMLAGAALVFAYASTSSNVVVHVAGLLVVAALVLPVSDILAIIFAAQNREPQVVQQPPQSDKVIQIERENSREAERIFGMLRDAEIVDLRWDISDNEMGELIGCLLDTADVRGVANEVVRQGSARHWLEALYEGRRDQEFFRPPHPPEFREEMDILQTLRLVDFPSDEYARASITPRGCRVSRQLNTGYSRAVACESWPDLITTLPPDQVQAELTREWAPTTQDQFLFGGEVDDDLRRCVLRTSIYPGEELVSDVEFFNPPFHGYVGENYEHTLSLETPQQAQTISLADGQIVGRWLAVTIGDLPAGESWELQVDLTVDPNSPLDPFLVLFDQQQRELLGENDDVDNSFNARVTVPVAQGAQILVGASDIALREGEMEIAFQLQPVR